MNLLIISPTTNVVLPISRAEAVETSAAQSPARTIPATKGLRLKTVRGRASVGIIPGWRMVAARPMIALIKPTGKISRPPKMKPRRAERESLAAKLAWTTDWTEKVIVHMTRNQAITSPHPTPPRSKPGCWGGSLSTNWANPPTFPTAIAAPNRTPT